MKNIFKGLGIALITPFQANGEVDYQALESLIESQISGGIDFLCVLGSTAETPCLTSEERVQIKKFVVDKVAGRLPILLGMGGNSTTHLVSEIKKFPMQGIDGLLSVCPFYNKPTQEGIYRHFEAISMNTDLPIVLYNVPGRTGINMLPATVLKLSANCSNVVAIKEASGNMQQILQILSEKDQEFDLLSGDDSLTYDAISQGAAGVISVLGNAFPALFGKMVHAIQGGNRKEALPINSQFATLYQALFTDGNPAGIKALLNLMGKCENTLRLPLVPATQSTTEILRQQYLKLK